ncbi:putative protoporphyrin ferrochelatase [Helianthus annuus]|nr:putative protoporphyrin ferrochelatase [Helianthus annuus]
MLIIYTTNPISGNLSSLCGNSDENASEHDFLRTKGGPGAFSYTINEALALIKSADALKMPLEAKKVVANVYVAMRYWHPFTEEVVQ